jgi:SAM-dependent methyltransferase
MGQSDPLEAPVTAGVARRTTGDAETTSANRRWWDAAAAGYQSEHGAFLGADGADFLWGPEGLREADAGLLGPVADKTVLEVGCGGGQCARWLATKGARVLGVDLSLAQLRHSAALDAGAGVVVPVAVGDAACLPIGDTRIDVACSAYGALPFVADSAAVMREVARVLRPGGRWVFSVTHPFRWCLPDDGGPAGLVVRDSYFDRRPYVELDDTGRAVYVEHHRTIGDRVRELVAAGFELLDVVEPEWPEGHDRSWGAWTPLRGRLLPGTAIFVTVKR